MDIRVEHSQKMIPRFQNNSNQDKRVEIGDAKLYLRKRYLVTSLVFLNSIVMGLIEMNVGISIVGMTSSKTVTVDNETFVREAEFHWSSKEKGILLSAFPVGLVTAPVGALATTKFGSIRAFGAATSIMGCVTLLSPLIISWSTSAYFVARVLEGVCNGISFSSVSDVLRLWSIPSERNRVFSVIPLGYAFAAVLGFPVCGTILHLLDWRAVFYITGSVGVVWSILWFTLVSAPQKDKLMSAKESRFVLASNKYTSTQKVTYPWKEISKSKAVLAYLNDRFVEAWSTSFLAYCFPLFIKDVHDVNVQDIGFISGIPHFVGIFGMVGASTLADFLIKRGILSTSNVHKLYLSSTQMIVIILLITAALWKNVTANIIIFSIIRLCYNFACISYMVLPVEMAGQYSPIIQGFGSTGFALGSFASPVLMGLIVSNHSPSEWSIYFAVISTFNFWGAIIFYRFGSGNLQPWALTPPNPAFNGSQSEKKMQLDID